jgi:hypothetical protein
LASKRDPAALGHPSQRVRNVRNAVLTRQVVKVSETRLVAAKRKRTSPDGFPTYDPTPDVVASTAPPQLKNSYAHSASVGRVVGSSVGSTVGSRLGVCVGRVVGSRDGCGVG